MEIVMAVVGVNDEVKSLARDWKTEQKQVQRDVQIT